MTKSWAILYCQLLFILHRISQSKHHKDLTHKISRYLGNLLYYKDLQSNSNKDLQRVRDLHNRGKKNCLPDKWQSGPDFVFKIQILQKRKVLVHTMGWNWKSKWKWNQNRTLEMSNEHTVQVQVIYYVAMWLCRGYLSRLQNPWQADLVNCWFIPSQTWKIQDSS